jgi:hypothetical protein
MHSGIASRPFAGTPQQPVAGRTLAGRATFYSFLTRSSGLSKPSPLSLSFAGMRPPSRPFSVFTPGRGRKVASPQFHMPTLILSTLALLGCAFLIYVFFHWLRDELNPKRPMKRIQRRPQSPAPQRPYVIRYPHQRSM